MLSDNDRFQLKKMLEANGVEDQTIKIRENQHSAEIRRCIQCIVAEKAKGLTKPEVEAAVAVECSFLFFHYFEIYNMVLKDVDLAILHRLLDVLEQIETGACDQHEGSFLVGKLLKEVYIDGIIRATNEEAVRPQPKNITWARFKHLPASNGALEDAQVDGA
jgi:hypothetical protein